MPKPTQDEINPFDDLDGRSASEHFYGKDRADAERMFEEFPGRYDEDLMFMGPVAFRYYVPAVIRYLRRAENAEASSVLKSLVGTLEFRLEYEPLELAPIADELASVCGYMLDHYDRIGGLPGSAEEMQFLVEHMREAWSQFPFELDPAHPNPEDWIDVRPRCRVLQQEFRRLAQS